MEASDIRADGQAGSATGANLVALAAAGDRAAYSQLLRGCYGAAVRTAQAILNRRDGAEDIVQETAIKCFRAMPTLENLDRFEPWFFQAVRNTALNLIRKRKREDGFVSIEPDFEPNPGPGGAGDGSSNDQPAMEVAADELRQIVDRAVAGIENVEMRACFVLYWLEELPHKQIADRLGITEGLSKYNVCMARKIVAEALGKAKSARRRKSDGVQD